MNLEMSPAETVADLSCPQYVDNVLALLYFADLRK